MLTGRYACYDVYSAADGRWLAVAAIEPRFWANLCRKLDLEHWIDHQVDDGVQDRIREDLRTKLATRDRDDWVAELGPADTCVAPVLSVPEMIADAQLSARESFVFARHPQHGEFRQVGPTLAGCERPEAPYDVRDSAVTDTDQLLADAGLSADDREGLRRAGVVA
jgi:alpha-methylacyl-CoA racemase